MHGKSVVTDPSKEITHVECVEDYSSADLSQDHLGI